MRLSAALKEFWMILGHYREARTFLERALALSEGTQHFLACQGLTSDCICGGLSGRH